MRVLVLLFVLLISFGARAADLKYCVVKALAENPTVKKALAGEKQALGEKELVVSQFFPTLYFVTSYFRSGGTGLSPADIYSYNFQVDWELFSGFSTYNRYLERRLLSLASRSQVKSVMMDVALEVVRAYTLALAKQAEMKAAEAYVESANYTLKLAKRRYEVGLAPYADVLHAVAGLRKAQFELADREREYEKALGDLAVAMGESPGEDMTLEDVNVVMADFDLKSLFGMALELSPEVKTARLKLEAQEKSVASVKGEFVPKVVFSSSWGKEDESFWPDDRESWSVGIKISLPIFTGLSTWKKLKVEKARLLENQFELKRVELEVKNRVWKAYQEYEKTKKRLIYAKRFVESSEEDLRIMRKKYRVGLATVVDLTTTQADYYRAKSAYFDAYYQLVLAYYSLVRAVGKIPVVEGL